MATIGITDNFGLVLGVKADLGSVFGKYLKSPSTIVGVLRNQKPIKDLLLSDDPFDSQTAGIAFTEPITLRTTGVELTIQPTVTGTIGLTKGASLFDADSDPFRKPIPIPTGQAYLSFAIAAELNLGLNDNPTDLQFGFTKGTTFTLTNYRRNPLTAPLIPALEHLVRDYALPGDLEDIEQLTQGDVITLAGTGSLQITAQANLLSVTNPLASVSVPFMPIQVVEGSGLLLKGAYTLTGTYHIRIERLDGQKFRLGYHKQRTCEFDVSVQAQVNTDVTAEGFDLLQSVLQAVSPDPVPGMDTFHKAGLTDDQISTIADAVKVGIERSVAISLSGELNSIDSDSTVFSYLVDAGALDAAGKQALHDAIDGDLTGLETTNHAGITRETSIIETLRQGKRILKVNLLGIYTHASVTTLFQKGTVIVDPETGDITITDQVGASRIESTANNFAKNGAKLRQVLAESLLLTAAYRSTGAGGAGPQLASHYWFFALHQTTNRQQVQDDLNVAEALRLLSSEARTANLDRLAGTSAFGRSTLLVDGAYTDELCKRMFLDNAGQARTEEFYQQIGRQALLLLLPAGDPINNARRLPLSDDALWKQMTTLGQPGFPTLLGQRNLNANQIADISSDYTLITWWASAMHNMGTALAAIVALLAANRGVDLENNTFKQLRSRLENAMAKVLSNTQAQFGQPFGILALDLASGQQAATTIQLTSPRFNYAASRTTQKATNA